MTVKKSGRMDLNGNSERIGTWTMQGSTIETGGGLLTFGGHVTGRADVHVAFIHSSLSLGGATRTIDIANGSAGPDMQINAAIPPRAGDTSPARQRDYRGGQALSGRVPQVPIGKPRGRALWWALMQPRPA